MAGEAAFALSAAAAAQAASAHHAADRAERQAFVNGYSHATATPAERERYVESVRVLYPEPRPPERKAVDSIAIRCLGLVLVAAVLCPVVGGLVAWRRGEEISEGVAIGAAIVISILVATAVLAILFFGFALLLGGIGPT